MPDRNVKTIRDLIYYQYAKIIVKTKKPTAVTPRSRLGLWAGTATAKQKETHGGAVG